MSLGGWLNVRCGAKDLDPVLLWWEALKAS